MHNIVEYTQIEMYDNIAETGMIFRKVEDITDDYRSIVMVMLISISGKNEMMLLNLENGIPFDHTVRKADCKITDIEAEGYTYLGKRTISIV